MEKYWINYKYVSTRTNIPSFSPYTLNKFIAENGLKLKKPRIVEQVSELKYNL
jgi:hypothetical protein